jgi:RimM protein, required for 16S rRNA processing
MISENEIVHIGRIQRTHGTGGELQCRMLNTLWEDNEAAFIILNVDEIFVPFRVTDWRTKGSEDVLLTLQGVTAEQQAARFVGCEAYMLRTDLPADIEAHTDLSTLTGYTVCDIERGALGEITAIDTSTLNTLVQLNSGALLPLHEDFIVELREADKQIIIRAPQGLI